MKIDSIADDSFLGRAICVACFVLFFGCWLLAGAASKDGSLLDGPILGLIGAAIGFGVFYCLLVALLI
jgi:hypothetical protein